MRKVNDIQEHKRESGTPLCNTPEITAREPGQRCAIDTDIMN